MLIMQLAICGMVPYFAFSSGPPFEPGVATVLINQDPWVEHSNPVPAAPMTWALAFMTSLHDVIPELFGRGAIECSGITTYIIFQFAYHRFASLTPSSGAFYRNSASTVPFLTSSHVTAPVGTHYDVSHLSSLCINSGSLGKSRQRS